MPYNMFFEIQSDHWQTVRIFGIYARAPLSV